MGEKRTEAKTKAVYALVDPRDGTVRYVGASKRPEVRWRQHCKGGSHFPGAPYRSSSDWVGELTSLGLTPDLRILEEPCEDWNAREVQWQRRHASTILNTKMIDGLVVDVRPAVASALRAVRENSGLTQSTVASMVNRSPNTVYRWETGQRMPDVNDFAVLAATYQVEPSAFFPSREVIQEAINSIEGES